MATRHVAWSRHSFGGRWARGSTAVIAFLAPAMALTLSACTGSGEATATSSPPTVTVTATSTATTTATATATVTVTTTVRPPATTATAHQESGAATTPQQQPTESYVVSRVVDGDTVELNNGETVRIAGIDTPERGQCGYAEATAHMDRLVLGKQVVLGTTDEDRDAYGRLLRYVDVGPVDAGLSQIEAGLAIARYDSRDGYGYHPRQDSYIAADARGTALCDQPTQSPQPTTTAPERSSTYFENCTAARAAGAAPVHQADRGYGSHLDGDGDGVGCED